MIYIRFGGGPRFTVLVHDGPAEDENVIREIAAGMPFALTFKTGRGRLGPVTDQEVEYLYDTDEPLRYVPLNRILLIKKLRARLGIGEPVEYNERSGSPELGIAPPPPPQDRSFLSAVNDDTFARLRDRFLDGDLADGTLTNAAELLRISREWPPVAYDDAAVLLMTTVDPKGYLIMTSYLGRLGAPDWRVRTDLGTAADGAAKAKPFGDRVDDTISAALWIARNLSERGWQNAFESFSIVSRARHTTSLGSHGPLGWLFTPARERVRRYLTHEDLTPAELLDLIAQEPPEGYALERVLSTSSAFKIVYLATDDRGRVVVLKRYKWGSAEMTALANRLATDPERMLEKDTLTDWIGEVRHPHIQPCMLLRNRRKEAFILEPRLESTLDALVKDPAAPDRLEMLFAQVVEAVAYLHQRGIVHTDIKPDNIGLRNGEALLLDFGIATFESGARKANPGSLKTRAPELFGTDVAPTAASDVWALGATALALASGGEYPLIGKRELSSLPRADDPRRGETEALIRKRIAGFREDGRSLERHLDERIRVDSAPLRNVILRACRIDPQKRPSARELLSLLAEGH